MCNSLRLLIPVLFVFSTITLSAQEKTFEREYTYKASEMDSKISCRAIAINELRAELLNEIGVYVENEQLLKSVDVGGEFSQDYVENIVTLTAGITKLEVLEERWNGETFWMKAAITIDKKSLEESLKQLIQDRQKTKELEDLKQQLVTATTELERLKKESANNQYSSNSGEEKIHNQNSQKYNTEINTLISVDYLFNAEQKLSSNNFTGALEDYNKAIDINPLNEKAYYNRGITKYALQDYDGAIEDYTKAIKLNAKNENTFNNRGSAKSKLQNYSGALDDFERSIKINPNNPHSYFNRGNLKYGRKDYRGAFIDYNKAIQLNPRYDDAYNNRGNLRTDLQEYKLAISDYNQALAINPNNSKAYHNRGVAKSKLHNYTGAIIDYNQAILINSKYADAYVNRAHAKIKSGQKDSGCPDFRKAEELGNKNAPELLKQYCQ